VYTWNWLAPVVGLMGVCAVLVVGVKGGVSKGVTFCGGITVGVRVAAEVGLEEGVCASVIPVVGETDIRAGPGWQAASKTAVPINKHFHPRCIASSSPYDILTIL